jgi:hypothetical protein
MRTTLLCTAVMTAMALITGAAWSQDPGAGYGGYDECDPCADYGNGRSHHGRHGKRRQSSEGMSASFNCGCNGSYKFPVPPLYTYHWPGQYSHQLMTDYHSPWRFPPIKPYADELPAVEMGMEQPSLRRVQPVSATVYDLRPVGQMTPMSERMLRD